MRRDETLRLYTNRYFENRNILAGVKNEDVITYYKKGVTNINLFEKIHEADAHTIADLMAYVDMLVDTQDAVMPDFNGEDHDDSGNRSRKQFGEAYVADPQRSSTFLEGDFNMVMDDQCQFHRDAKHTMRECEQLKRALGVPSESRKVKSNNNDDHNDDRRYDNCNCRPDQHDYHDRQPYRRNDDRDLGDYHRDYRRDDRHDDYRRNDRHEDNRNDWREDRRDDRRDHQRNDRRDDRVMVDVARMTTTAVTTTARSTLHHHHLKGATPIVSLKQPTGRPTSSSVVDKRPKAIGSSDQLQARLDTSTLKLHNLWVGPSSRSLSPGRSLGPHT
jgi:hypothetical protein